MKGSAFADIMMRVKLVESATFVYHENLEGEVKWRERPAGVIGRSLAPQLHFAEDRRSNPTQLYIYSTKVFGDGSYAYQVHRSRPSRWIKPTATSG